MEQSTAYLIMIFLPVIPFFLKLTLSYRIRYKIPKLNVDKFYKKKKSSFFRRYFYIEQKQRIKPFLFVANLLTGILLVFSVLISLLYLALAICQHKLICFIVPQSATYVTIVLTIVLMVYGTLEILDDKRR